MTLLPPIPPFPAPRPSFWVYVVLDPSVTPVTPIEIRFSRQEARKALEWREDADRLRVKRARVILYES